MFFKLTRSNPYRDFVRNARRIALSTDDNTAKVNNYVQLYTLLSPRMLENERLLNASPAFSKRAEHWNQRDIASIRAVTNLKNPWLCIKREIATALEHSSNTDVSVACNAISRALGWFYANEHRDDWIVD